MIAKLLVVCLLSCIHSINSASAPFVKKCSLNNSKCVKASTQEVLPIFAAGIPELGVEVMDPLHLKFVDASATGLRLNLKDVVVEGLSKCAVKKSEIDESNSKLLIKLLCTVDVQGQYDINGNIVVLPIEGNGDAHIVLRDILITGDVNLVTKKGKDGLDHWSIKSYEHSYELKSKATIELENLFNGNEDLGRAAKELFKASPNEIVTEIGPPIVKAVVHTIVENVNKFFRKVSLNELVES